MTTANLLHGAEMLTVRGVFVNSKLSLLQTISGHVVIVKKWKEFRMSGRAVCFGGIRLWCGTNNDVPQWRSGGSKRSFVATTGAYGELRD